jgi:hypothetical protein
MFSVQGRKLNLRVEPKPEPQRQTHGRQQEKERGDDDAWCDEERIHSSVG